MNSLEQIDLSEAFKMYSISNTPLFLMKRLKTDSATLDISRNFSGDKILAALQELVEAEPRDAVDYVRPYVYLVALSQLPDIKCLQSAGDLKGTEKWDWFRYIQRVLIATYSPSINEFIDTQKVLGYSAVQSSASEFSNIQLAEATPWK